MQESLNVLLGHSFVSRLRYIPSSVDKSDVLLVIKYSHGEISLKIHESLLRESSIVFLLYSHSWTNRREILEFEWLFCLADCGAFSWQITGNFDPNILNDFKSSSGQWNSESIHESCVVDQSILDIASWRHVVKFHERLKFGNRAENTTNWKFKKWIL